MKILVTGGMGFIGSHLIDKLVKLNHEVASFDAFLNFTNNQSYYQRCLKIRKKIHKSPHQKFKGDIRDIDKLKKALRKFNPEVIVHLAAISMARVPDNFKHLMIPINGHGTFNVIETFEESDSRRIIYTSSSMAYGHFKQTPQTEEFILNPTNHYGATKAAGEYFIKLSKKEHVIVRPTSVYGFTDCANRVTQILLDAAHLKKKAWVVKGETLDFSYVDDVVDGFVKSITSKKALGNTFNISRGEARAASEFAEELKKYFPDFEYEVREPQTQQVWRGPLDISKAKTILKFNPKVSIEKGIKNILELVEEYNFYKNL